MITIRPVPFLQGYDSAGHPTSRFSPSTERVRATGQWTWERVGHDGTFTTGMNRPPVDSYALALAFARKVQAAIPNVKVLP